MPIDAMRSNCEMTITSLDRAALYTEVCISKKKAELILTTHLQAGQELELRLLENRNFTLAASDATAVFIGNGYARRESLDKTEAYSSREK